MLLGNFFEISSLNNVDNKSIEASIKINKDHDIFKGHFPDFPIVPGVCLIQIVKEIIENIQETSLTLIKGDNIKFLNSINPNISETVNVKISNNILENNTLKSDVQIYSGETIFLKLKGVFQKDQ